MSVPGNRDPSSRSEPPRCSQSPESLGSSGGAESPGCATPSLAAASECSASFDNSGNLFDSLEWGTHFCHLYESADDLLQFQSRFLAKGLEKGEAGAWLLNTPLTLETALDALFPFVPSLRDRLEAGQLVVESGTAHYQTLTPRDAVRFWAEKEEQALSRGYSGLRITGNVHSRLDAESWNRLMEYEQLTDDLLHQRRMMSWCAYHRPSLDLLPLIDVVSRHQGSLQRGRNGWTVVWNHESRRLKALHKESQALLSSFYRSAPLLMGVVEVLADNSDLVHLHDNPATCAFFRLPGEATTGRRASSLGVEPGIVNSWIVHCRKSEQSKSPVRFEHTFGPGEEARWLSVMVTFIDGHDDGRARFAYIAEDITDRRKAEQQIRELLQAERLARGEFERANRLKDEFIATVSHELRTPLNAILGWTQLLRRRVDPTGDLGEGLEIVERNARLQTQLIDDLLDMSRISSGKVRLDIQYTDFSEVARATVASIRPAAEAKDIALDVHITCTSCLVAGDSGRLQQVLWNLITNAVKFTPKGGSVSVRLTVGGDSALLEVRDTGQGINPDFLPFVFDRFRQADASLTRRHGGLGIGLAIVKHIVELHGGSVKAESDGEGRGATFRVSLPVVLPSVTAVEAPRMPPSTEAFRERLRGLKVLVLDDEPDARGFVARVLAECGVEALQAASADEGLRALKLERPDLVISDISMPDKDGYDFIRALRALPAEDGGDTPAAALTAFVRSDDRRRAIDAGYQLHLAKPILPVDLIAAVAALEDMRAKRPRGDESDPLVGNLGR